MGSDIKAGQPVLQAGDLLGAAEIGVLATVGVATVKVIPHEAPCASLVLHLCKVQFFLSMMERHHEMLLLNLPSPGCCNPVQGLHLHM